MMLHRIANGIVEEDAENGCAVIAFEELTGLRDRLPGASWGLRPVVRVLAYKAELHGIDVEQADPENTSRRCSTCGFTHPDNREGEDFECLNCGYENHADYNAVARTAGSGGQPDSGDVWRRRRTSACGLSAGAKPGTAEACSKIEDFLTYH